MDINLLFKVFGENIKIDKINKYKTESLTIRLKGENREITFDSKKVYECKIFLSSSFFRSRINNGVIVRKIHAKNSILSNNVETKFSILYDEVLCSGNVKYEIYGYSKKFFHFIRIINQKNSSCEAIIRLYNKKFVISIGEINIPKNSVNSQSKLEKIFINDKDAKLISLPILKIENRYSKAYHSSKTLKLDENQKFYLLSKGIKNIEELVFESFIS